MRNIDNPDQLRALIDDIKTITNGVTKLYIDQEGGRVQRLFEPYWTRFSEVCAYDNYEDDAFERAVFAHYRLIGDELKAVGIDVNCAPCLDMRHPQTATFLHDRTFAGGKSRLVLAGEAARRGLEAAGVFPVAKHIPGHGLGSVDSHLSLPVVEFEHDPYEQLPVDAKVFRELAFYPFGMCAHILYPQIDADNPMTLSKKGFEYIRNNVGFTGVMLSDDLDMKALTGTQAELATQSLSAGADLALSCLGDQDHIRQLHESALEMPDVLAQRLSKLYDGQKSYQPLTADEREALWRDIKRA